MHRNYYILCGILFFLLSCQQEDEELTTPFSLPELPSHFEEIPFPEDNAFTLERWKLGKELFFSTALSKDNTLSCASCHNPTLAFADNIKVSLGIENRPGTRNVPSLANGAYHPYYTREGAVPTLEMQILIPIQEHNEFDFNILLIEERLAQDPEIIELADRAYDRLPDPFTITRALSTFERSLISAGSNYDKYLEGTYTLSEREEAGRQLFFSDRLACATCHNGFDFTDYSITNNGLYENYDDPGRYRVTYDSMDLATFKIPSLRNVELTAPYMHDGSLESLEEVVEHYTHGVKNHMNKDIRLIDFTLAANEQLELISFLKTLTDEDFISNPHFQESN